MTVFVFRFSYEYNVIIIIISEYIIVCYLSVDRLSAATISNVTGLQENTARQANCRCSHTVAAVAAVTADGDDADVIEGIRSVSPRSAYVSARRPTSLGGRGGCSPLSRMKHFLGESRKKFRAVASSQKWAKKLIFFICCILYLYFFIYFFIKL